MSEVETLTRLDGSPHPLAEVFEIYPPHPLAVSIFGQSFKLFEVDITPDESGKVLSSDKAIIVMVHIEESFPD